MKRSEAIALQQRVLSRGMNRTGDPEIAGRSGEDAVETLGISPEIELAVGIQGSGDDFVLAVRSTVDSARVRATVEQLEDEGPLDFEVVGPVRALQAPWHQSQISPLWPGCSGAHWQERRGTLGCFVRRNNDAGSARYVLSNNHVLAREEESLPPVNGGAVRVIQPCLVDKGDPSSDVIAFLEDWVPLQEIGNIVDAAIARLDDNVALMPGVLDQLGNLTGERPTHLPLSSGELVHKVGRSTGTTSGRIKAMSLNPLSVDFPWKRRSFVQVIEIEPVGAGPFCDDGDSGSLLVDHEFRAIGLLFAKAVNGNGYANPIHEVTTRLGISLVV